MEKCSHERTRTLYVQGPVPGRAWKGVGLACLACGAFLVDAKKWAEARDLIAEATESEGSRDKH